MSSGRSCGRILRGPLPGAAWAGSVLLVVYSAAAQPAVPPAAATGPAAACSATASCRAASADGRRAASGASARRGGNSPAGAAHQRAGDATLGVGARRSATRHTRSASRPRAGPGRAAAGGRRADSGVRWVHRGVLRLQPPATSNGITNFRGFDNRHNTFTLSNAALGAKFDVGPVGGRLMLQVGSTPTTYYGAEPVHAGAGGADATGPASVEVHPEGLRRVEGAGRYAASSSSSA